MATSFEIHPAIGITRVGSSDEFFVGPEPDGAPPERYRDVTGALKRQAARFRIFECERHPDGRLLSAREIDAGVGVQITWTVHLVNRKGAAPNFAKPGGGNRNRATGDANLDRHLIIDPGPRTCGGISAGPIDFDSGTFMGVPVPLGELRTDGRGRLLVCGGHGISDSVPAQPNADLPIQGFADSNGWYDDTSDGPVRATLSLPNGRTAIAKAAWVIVGPPDFAPDIHNLVTLYDVAYDVAVERGELTPPETPSFRLHIQPILQRAVNYQWVNRFAVGGHAGSGPGNFAQDWAALADPNNPPEEAQIVLQRLRDSTRNPVPAPAEPNPRRWMPRLHDDSTGDAVLPLTRTQYAALEKWAAGHFVADLDAPPAPESLPDALDRVALQACSGGPFFPGIEAGRITRDPRIYSEPFRLNADLLEPGQITAGNAVPWQADYQACEWEPHGFIGWWPAQRPDHVRPEDNPTVFENWDRGITSVLDDSDRDMMDGWHRLGIVRRRSTPAGDLFVETERDPTLP